MLDNVFDSKEILNYIFSIDYIYNFLQIKLIYNENPENALTSNEESDGCPKNNRILDCSNSQRPKNNHLFFDDEYKSMFRSQENSISLVKLSMDYKKKQKISYFKSFDWQQKESIWSKSFEEKHNDSLGELSKLNSFNSITIK